MFITSKNKYLSNDMKIFGTCSIPLSLNIQKCEFQTVGTQQCLTKFKYVNIKIDEIDIVKVTPSKYLGFIIDQTLRWGHHI